MDVNFSDSGSYTNFYSNKCFCPVGYLFMYMLGVIFGISNWNQFNYIELK